MTIMPTNAPGGTTPRRRQHSRRKHRSRVAITERAYNRAMRELKELPFLRAAYRNMLPTGTDGAEDACLPLPAPARRTRTGGNTGADSQTNPNRETLLLRITRLEQALSLLDGEEQDLLCRLAYGERGVVEDLCFERNCDKSTLYRCRRRALQKMALALYGSPE